MRTLLFDHGLKTQLEQLRSSFNRGMWIAS